MSLFFLALLFTQGGWSEQTFEEKLQFDSHIWYGKALAGLGDVDGDGYGDFGVSAPLARPVSYVEARSGRSGRLIWSVADRRQGIGWTLSSAGDVDGDGAGDLVCSIGSGSLRVLSGCDGSQIFEARNEAYARAIRAGLTGVEDAGIDADLDGVCDLLVDAMLDAGEDLQPAVLGARVLSGTNGNPLLSLDSAEGWRAACFTEDLDQDGRPEVLTWHPGLDRNKRHAELRLRVVSPGSAREFWSSELLTCGEARTAFCRLGDVDGDSIGDVAIGSTCDIGPAIHLGGSVWIVSGRTGGVIHALSKDQSQSLFGYCLAAAGDIDGDGVGDLLIGEYGSWTRGYFLAEGRIHMVSGSSGKTLWTQMDADPERSPSWEYFGASVASIGDVDGDAIPDVAVGAMNDYEGAFYPGAVHVFSGRDGRWLYSLP